MKTAKQTKSKILQKQELKRRNKVNEICDELLKVHAIGQNVFTLDRLNLIKELNQ